MWQAYQVCGGGVMRRKRNLEHLANCPFCGNHELEFEDSTGDITCNCCAYTFYDTSEDNGWWNTRPIEDVLRAENDRLREALKYIVDRGYTGASYVAQQALNEVTK
jgi:hypothetical protein